jgi:hypothetical protein
MNTYFLNCPEELYKISLIIKRCPEEILGKLTTQGGYQALF